jgi:hypothetical protein
MMLRCAGDALGFYEQFRVKAERKVRIWSWPIDGDSVATKSIFDT